MDISGLNSAYADYYDTARSNASASRLRDTLSNKGTSGSTDDELMDVCRQFESYLLEQVMKGMEKTVMKADEGDSSTGMLVDYFKEQTIQTLAEQSTEQSPLGLAQMLYEQLKRNLGQDPKSITAEQLAEGAAASGVDSAVE